MTMGTTGIETGQRNRLVTIEKRTLSYPADGDPVEAWTTHKTAWGRVKYVTGDERARGGQKVERATHTVRMPWADGITERMRVALDNVNYYIVAINDRCHAEVELVLFCRLEAL